MESIIQSDIFFFITSISIIIFTVFFIIIGFYVIKIVKNFSRISEVLKDGVNTADAEIREIGEHVRESAIFSFIFGKKRKRTKNKKS